MIQIDNNYLIIDKRKIEFEAPISEYIEYDDLIILILDYKSYILNNVYAVNKNDGSIKWQTEDSSHYIKRPVPFTTVGLINNNIVAWDWNSCRFFLNPNSGEIIYLDHGK